MENECPFSATLLSGGFGCRHAREVSTRTGPDIRCDSGEMARTCTSLLACLKQEALPAFGVADDLLEMPHSVLVKIQSGGLLGLQRLLGVELGAQSRVDDIAGLVGRIALAYGDASRAPAADVVADMTGYALKRRRRR